MALNKDGYDPYWYYAQRGNRSTTSWWWRPPKVKGVAVEDVACPECNYKPQSTALDPMANFRRHVREKHRATFFRMYKPPPVIKEEPDLPDSPTVKDLLDAL